MNRNVRQGKNQPTIVGCPAGDQDCGLPGEIERLKAEIKRLSELVATDPLTGLKNYRFFIESLERELERTRRTGLSTAMIFMDLDFFKKINDSYGHEAGNEALCFTSSMLQKFTRQLDVTCRYGGEEFVIILPATGLQRAVNTAERLREKLSSTPLRLNDEDIFITASFGVDVFNHRDRYTPAEFIEKVDSHLLQAKETGRNKVCSGKSEERINTQITGDEKNAIYSLTIEDQGE